MESCFVDLHLRISLALLVVNVVQPLEHWKLVIASSVLALEEGLASCLLVALGNENFCLTVHTTTWYYFVENTVEHHESNHQLGTKTLIWWVLIHYLNNHDLHPASLVAKLVRVTVI